MLTNNNDKRVRIVGELSFVQGALEGISQAVEIAEVDRTQLKESLDKLSIRVQNIIKELLPTQTNNK